MSSFLHYPIGVFGNLSIIAMFFSYLLKIHPISPSGSTES